MEERKLSPQESMELIASMIQTTRRQVASRDLRVSVMWAALSIITAIVAWTLIAITKDAWFNFVWFAIPVIGLPANIFLVRNSRRASSPKTYLDRVMSGLWRYIGIIAIGLTIGCIVAQLCGYPEAWLSMFYYAFIVIGFGAMMSGVLLRENSYVFGGLFSIFAGFAVIIVNLCDKPLLYTWTVPLYIASFLLMFIVPAIVMKTKTEER